MLGLPAWSACSLLYLLKAFSFRRHLLSIYSVPDFGPGSGDTKMSKAGSLLCQELSALIGATCKQIFPHRIISVTLEIHRELKEGFFFILKQDLKYIVLPSRCCLLSTLFITLRVVCLICVLLHN